MPANFPEVWLDRVIENMVNTDNAAWLDGVAEVAAEVTVLGAGSASEKNVIHIPRSEFKPDVLINNSTYPIALQEFTDDEVVVSLDKYQTKATTLADDDIVGASYDKIDVITKKHTKQIASSKYKKALHAIAPQTDGTETPVIVTTGSDDNGRKRMAYEDLVKVREKFAGMADGEGVIEDIRIVLSAQHYSDLLLDRERFGNLIANHKEGTVAPRIAGLDIFTYNGSPLYDNTGAKKAFGAVKTATDNYASVAFYTPNIAKKTGLTKQYFAKAEDNPTTQTNVLNYRHYFIAVPAENKYIAAVVNG